MNRFLLVAIALLLLFGLIGHFSPLSTTFTIYADGFIIVAENLGITMMLVNGTFIRTRLFKIALFFLGLTVVGFLFKIMHMPGADELLVYPFIVLFCLYLIHFILKRSKQRTDVLKVLMLITFLIFPQLITLHLIPEEYREVLLLISHVPFWLTFLDFLYSSHKQGLLLKNSRNA